MTANNSFDFDKHIDRRGTHSEKWRMFEQANVLPLWLADMDFLSPPAVIEALHKRVDHGVFGYTNVPDELVETVLKMLQAAYGWTAEREWLVWLPGLVSGLNIACRSLGDEGDDVLSAVPVYPPFLSAPRYSKRNLVTVPLVQASGRWVFDFNRLEDAITPRTRLLLLCNPHNPVGRVFSRQELSTILEICRRHDMIVCSDEIHCGLILDQDKSHIPTATLGTEAAERTITLMSPSKTFNIPGLGCSFAIIPNAELRRGFRNVRRGIVPSVNLLALAASTAAYKSSSVWHAALLDYLRGNREAVTRAIERMPGLSTTHVEATYLAWIDTRQAGLMEPAKFFAGGGVGLADGVSFGGPGFVRLTFGCPRSTLVDALRMMELALTQGNRAGA